MESARPATPDDVAVIALLAARGLEEQRAMRGGELWARREAPGPDLLVYLQAHLEASDRSLFAGTIDDEIVGFATARVDVLRDGGRLGVIEEIYVDEGARMVGVGEALAEAVLAWCEVRDCVGIDAAVLPGNRAAKNFFETNGFVARRIVMHRRRGPRS